MKSKLKISAQKQIKFLPYIIAIAFFMQMLDNSILNTAIPQIAHYMDEKPVDMNLAITSYMLSVAVFLPISGWLSDRFGLKNVFMGAIVIFTMGSLFCALSNSLAQLSISRVIQGIGGALLVPIGRLAVLKVFPREKYAKVISLIVLPALIGPLIGPTIGGFIVELFSWHWIFLINIPIGVFCFAASMQIMPDIAAQKSKLDWKGFLLFDLAVLLFFLFGSSNENIGLAAKGFVFLSALLVFLLYALYAKSTKNPLFEMEIFKVKHFNIGLIGVIISRIVGGSMAFLGPLFLQTALGFAPSKAGAALIPLGVGAMFAKSLVVYLINRLGYRLFLISASFCMGAGIFSMIFIDAQTPIYAMLIIFGLIGLFNSLIFTATNALTMLDAPVKFLSGANTLLSVAMQLALALGVSISAILIGELSEIKTWSLISVFHGSFIAFSTITFLNIAVFAKIESFTGKS
jgi:EmrB/QacA subfamily drug resistance transporter